MTDPDRRPVTVGWIWLGLGIALFATICTLLGFWQLDRADERSRQNEILAARLSGGPVPLDALILEGVEQDPEDLSGWPVILEGTWVPAEQVLIRGRALEGTPGFWVVAPFRADGGLDVLVKRGWVGLEYDDPLDPRLQPPDGTGQVTGITTPGQKHTGVGPEDPPDGHLAVLGILDIERIGAQAGLELAPVVVQAVDSMDPLRALPLPDTDESGPHFAYAIQWFGFAVVAVVGFGALAGQQLGRGPFARFLRPKEKPDVPIDHRPPTDGPAGREE